jgi:hypothetical protein
LASYAGFNRQYTRRYWSLPHPNPLSRDAAISTLKPHFNAAFAKEAGHLMWILVKGGKKVRLSVIARGWVLRWPTIPFSKS